MVNPQGYVKFYSVYTYCNHTVDLILVDICLSSHVLGRYQYSLHSFIMFRVRYPVMRAGLSEIFL